MVPSRTNSKPRSLRAGNSRTSTIRQTVTPEERQRMISEAAYYKAESRGFSEADPDRDWYEAEAEIDGMLGGKTRRKSPSSRRT